MITNNSSFKSFNIQRTYNELYYQFPKIFIHGNTYKKLSHSAKISYMLLRAKLEFAIHKKQFDENGDIYFEFTVSELCKLLDCSNKTAIKIKKELTEYNLLKEVKMGFNPRTKKNNNNRLYLSELHTTENDVYSIIETENVGNSGSVKSTPRKVENHSSQSLDISGSVKSTPRENVGNSGSVKSTPIFNNNLDTLQDTLQDTVTSEIDLDIFTQNLENNLENPATYSIPEKAKKILTTYALNDSKKVYEQIGMIFRAKKEVALKTNTVLRIEDYEKQFVEQVGMLAIQIYKDKKYHQKIENYDNYFYKSFIAYFESQATMKKEKDPNSPKIPLDIWI